jgi:hypothetical protein
LRKFFDRLNSLFGSTELLDLLLILSLSFVTFWRMGSSGLWEAYDQSFSLYPAEKMRQLLYVWNEAGTGFSTGIISSTVIPFSLPSAVLSYMGLPSSIIQKSLLIFYFALTGWGMYYLIRSLSFFKDEMYDRAAGILSSTFYMFNLFIIYWMLIGAYPQLPLAMLPFTFAFMYKGLKACEKKGEWVKYALLIALSSIFFVTVPEFMLTILFFFLLYFVYVALVDTLQRRLKVLLAKIKFLITTFLVSMLLNTYWLLPNIYATIHQQYLQSAISASPGISRVLSFFNAPKVMIQSLRLVIWILPVGEPITSLNYWVVSPYIAASGISLLVLAVVVLLLRLKDAKVVFFGLPLIFSIGFATGVPPFNSLYIWLYEHFPLFGILSDPHKFLLITLFSQSILLGIATIEIYNFVSKRRRRIGMIKTIRMRPAFLAIVMVIIIIILTNSYPLLNGNMNGQLEAVNIPSYYVEAGDWLRSQQDNFRVVTVPMNPPAYSPSYVWTPYGVANSVFWATGVMPVPVIGFSGWTSSVQINSQITNKTNQLGKIVSLWNVKYLIIENDMVNPATGQKIKTDDIQTIFNCQEDLQFVKTFGELKFYKNNVWHDNLVYGSSTYLVLPEKSEWTGYEALCNNLPDFNPTNSILFTSNSLPNTPDIYSNAVNISRYIAITEDQITFASLPTIPKSNMPVSYEKINPTIYIVHVDAETPFILGLSINYDPMWIAEISGENMPLQHFQINFYANGWYVNKTGKYDIVIEYEAQKALDAGLGISAITATVLLSYLVSPHLIKKVKKAGQCRLLNTNYASRS